MLPSVRLLLVPSWIWNWKPLILLMSHLQLPIAWQALILLPGIQRIVRKDVGWLHGDDTGIRACLQFFFLCLNKHQTHHFWGISVTCLSSISGEKNSWLGNKYHPYSWGLRLLFFEITVSCATNLPEIRWCPYFSSSVEWNLFRSLLVTYPN